MLLLVFYVFWAFEIAGSGALFALGLASANAGMSVAGLVAFVAGLVVPPFVTKSLVGEEL